MSVTYYIVDKKKKKEYYAFVKYWDNSLVPSIKNRLMKYGKKVDGVLVNEIFIEDLIDEKMPNMKYCPVFDDIYYVRLGQKGMNGFRFDNYLGIRCIEDLIKYLEEHPDCIIEDEEERNVTKQYKKLFV